jgi:hypothetical protein
MATLVKQFSLFTPYSERFGTAYSDGVRGGPLDAMSYKNGNQYTHKALKTTGGYISPTYNFIIKPAAPTADALLTAQIINAAGYAPLRVAPTGGVSVNNETSETLWVLDEARAITVTGVAGTTLAQVTVWGYDIRGVPMMERRDGPVGATTVTFQKAFKAISKIYFSAGTTANVTIGTSNVFGMPYRIVNSSQILKISFNNFDYLFGTTNASAAAMYTITGGALTNSGAFTFADNTSPATATTGDVRGTFAPTTLADGARQMLVSMNQNGQDLSYLNKYDINTEIARTIENFGVQQFWSPYV